MTVAGEVKGFTPVTDEMLKNPPPGDWLVIRRDYRASNYSPLNQITRDNVKDLRLQWVWAMNEGGANQPAPLVHNGVIFLNNPGNVMQAIDGRTGDLRLSAEGRAMATLDSPTAPGINQWYPVIYFRPQDPERRIWPPSYEGAPLTLRVVSMEQAANRLAGNLQRAWVERRDVELTAAAQP